MKKKNNVFGDQPVLMLVVMAMLAALQVVLSRFLSINTQITKIGFAFVPIAVCAMLFGPLPTAIVAVVADVLGASLFPSGPFFPGFTLTAVLNALVYGLLLYKKPSVLKAVIAVVINQFGLSLFLTPLWLSILYDLPYWVTVVGRLYQIAILTAVEIAVNILLIRLVPQLKRAMPMLNAQSRRAQPVIDVEYTEVLPESKVEALPETKEEDESCE